MSWRSAIHEWETAPLVGTGAGSFTTWWEANRPSSQQILDAHSLYLETLGELGIVGLCLLVGALLVPLVAACKARREHLVPFAAAGYAAWVVHAGVDWDWEIPAVTVAALTCGVIVSSAVGQVHQPGAKTRVLLGVAASAVALFGIVVGIGNQALASSSDALMSQNYARAETEARKAARWAPWSSEPWIVQGQLDALNQDRAAARVDFHKAIAKDPRNYLAWYGLAGVTRGPARAEAVRKVLELNPLSDEAKELSKGP